MEVIIMFYSPLRYPGGKGKLAPLMEILIDETGHRGGTYIEPFAGGAGIALELLEKGIVSQIVINDLDKGIYSFWRAILTETNRFIKDLNDIDISMDEWHRQRNICMKQTQKYSYELGFATFYMNRTNRSGIIKGGVIGGMQQAGKWKLNARFNKENLIERILLVAKNKSNIKLYSKDIESFLVNYVPKYEKNAFMYFDPPYFNKGEELYLNFFNYNDHKRIEKLINKSVNCDWVITYDDSPEIMNLYNQYVIKKFDLNYSAGTKRKASEIIIFKNDVMIPDEEKLFAKKVCINLR